MGSSLDSFAGVLPYASELFGLYKPLLGWRSRRRLARAHNEQLRLLGHVVAGMKGDVRVAQALGARAEPVRPDVALPARPPGWLRSTATSETLRAATTFGAQKGRPPHGAEWLSVLEAAALPQRIKGTAHDEAAAARSLGALEKHPAATPVAAASPHLIHEAVVAGTLHYLSQQAPSLMSALAAGAPARWQAQLPFLDPLAHFDAAAQHAFLSPIGLMHLYREYFFELETFLGPPVGHVWVSPGGSLEVYEVHTTRQLEERATEQTQESSTRVDSSLATEDELASAVATDNTQNMSLGVTSSAGVNMGVMQASASVNFNMATAHHAAQQDTHKHTRQQSEKVASEIRKSFKTTFRTSIEQTDQSSRRYVLENKTDKLVNYELRRKMRRIGVQVQHIGTQLCWQVYVDNPGYGLGIPELVHVAKPDDPSTSQPPEAPPPLQPQQTQIAVQVPFEPLGEPHENNDDDYIDGFEDGDQDGGDQIANVFPIDVIPPAAGYTLDPNKVMATAIAADGSTPAFEPAPFALDERGRLILTLHLVNFMGAPPLTVTLSLHWDPPSRDDQLKDWKEALAKYTAQQQRAAHAAYVAEVRSRVELAGKVQKRLEDDLRDEERVAVFRQLMAQLMSAAPGETPHVTSELVRSVFDVDRMLYFVAPDWWMPRAHATPRHPSSSAGVAARSLPRLVGGEKATSAATHASLAADDAVGWNGAHDVGHDQYLVTESSPPAPLGASLGWLLQLDADNRRNAFLNASWVKAVLPIQPGREKAALDWLARAHVEGSDGLDATLSPPDPSLPAAVKTIRDAIDHLAGQIGAAALDTDNVLATEKVFEKGFDPLETGFVAQPAPYAVFDQWIEVMPTEQVVAVEYAPPPAVPVG